MANYCYLAAFAAQIILNESEQKTPEDAPKAKKAIMSSKTTTGSEEVDKIMKNGILNSTKRNSKSKINESRPKTGNSKDGDVFSWIRHHLGSHEMKGFTSIYIENAVAIYTSVVHMLEFGVGGHNSQPLDFRANFMQTWLAVTLIGSMAVRLGHSYRSTALKSSLKGALIGLGFYSGLVLSSTFIGHHNGQAHPNQLKVIGMGAAAGWFGSMWTYILQGLVWNEEKPYYNENFGLEILSSTLSGLFLPRFALFMDANFQGSATFPWGALASLSTT